MWARAWRSSAPVWTLDWCFRCYCNVIVLFVMPSMAFQWLLSYYFILLLLWVMWLCGNWNKSIQIMWLSLSISIAVVIFVIRVFKIKCLPNGLRFADNHEGLSTMKLIEAVHRHIAIFWWLLDAQLCVVRRSPEHKIINKYLSIVCYGECLFGIRLFEWNFIFWFYLVNKSLHANSIFDFRA